MAATRLGGIVFLMLAMLLASRTTAADPAADAPLRIHIISGSGSYKSEPSLKELKSHLEQHYRVACTASWAKDGAAQLESLDSLPSADLLIVFARRLKLAEEQMAVIRKHWDQGKAVIGIRTASHAFQQADNDIFDKKVLGGAYSGYGSAPFKAIAAPAAADHPILKGVGPISSRTYYNNGKLSDQAAVLQIVESTKERKAPVSSTHRYQGGRTFYTSMGLPEDFQDENFRRLLINAIFWTTQRDPEKMKK